jgi:hypothetical protein
MAPPLSTRLLLPALLVATGLAGAAERALPLLDADGRRWEAVAHPEGVELRGPRGRLLLRPDCSARGGSLGQGRWQWANGGFMVELGAERFLFPRQQPPLDDPAGRCRL